MKKSNHEFTSISIPVKLKEILEQEKTEKESLWKVIVKYYEIARISKDNEQRLKAILLNLENIKKIIGEI